MSMFQSAERATFESLLNLALEEDLRDIGDVTSLATIPEGLVGKAALVCRTNGVLAGLEAATRTFERVEPRLKVTPVRHDGSLIHPGDQLAIVEGPMRGLLAAERTALNFIQRLSGVASITRQFVDLLLGLPVVLLDTRKTTPGWRMLEKYAVRMGGAANHRIGLYDAILIKDNHLAAVRAEVHDGTEIATAVSRSRALFPGLGVEVEVDSLEQFDRALACQPEIILLDNMSLDMMREAVRRRHDRQSTTLLEASGGVNLQTVRGIAETGVDRISVGALTHSAKALDIALDYID